MATQNIYKEKYIKELVDQVEKKASIELYKSEDSLFDKTQIFKLVGIERPEGLCENLCAVIDNDYKAAIILYEAYKDLSLLQASDNRLWIYLAHTELYKYVTRRHKVNNIVIRTKADGTVPDKSDSEKNFILEHWFGSYIRQSLSSLWWSVKMTIDEERKDPYELTEFLFRHHDFRTRRFASSAFARNKEGTIGLLEGMMNLDTYKFNFEARSNFAMMYFNYLGGTRQLTALDRNFFIKELKRIDSEVQKYETREDLRRNAGHLFDNL